jgi:sterol desaturase/sphingolipid hydroxylase (fatty acid hydroxylase superfamily)
MPSLELIITYTPILLTSILIVEFLYSLITKDRVYLVMDSWNHFLNMPVMAIVLRGIHEFFRELVLLAIPFLLFVDKVDFNWQSFLLSLLAVDFMYFSLHIAMHRFEPLWYFHAIHHSGKYFNLFINFRKSWLEEVSHMFITNGLLYVLTPLPMDMILLAQFFVHRYIFFTHSNYIKFPRFLGAILVLPQLHKIHHDSDHRNQMTNYGSMFSIWDHIIGTYNPAVANFKAGVKGFDEDNFFKLHLDPLVRLYKKYVAK